VKLQYKGVLYGNEYRHHKGKGVVIIEIDGEYKEIDVTDYIFIEQIAKEKSRTICKKETMEVIKKWNKIKEEYESLKK